MKSMRELPDRWRELGSFIREQRNTARLSLRRLSELAGISNPYLSQIERGLRRPSAEILQQIARALRISAETLYVQAGILDPPSGEPDLARHILADPHLTEEQRQALMRIYLSFRRENEARQGRGPILDEHQARGSERPAREHEAREAPGRAEDARSAGGDARPGSTDAKRVAAPEAVGPGASYDEAHPVRSRAGHDDADTTRPVASQTDARSTTRRTT
jgi:transcriptional regulator with XRE-family HTH domain